MYKNGKPNYNEVVFTDEQIQDIIDSYLNNESSVSIGKRYGVGHKVILKVLHKNNITVDQKKFVRKYELNEDYFDCIDTPNKAYILGFLWADGHNSISKGTIAMSLQEEDREILELIRLELGSNKPLEFLDYSNKHDFGYSYKNQYRLNVFSTHMCETLEKLGMTPNKSLSLEFPNIPEDLYRHFIRGYFDGDGTITKSGVIAIVSTKQFIESVNRITMDVLNIDSGRFSEASNQNGITYNIHWRKGASKKILDWFYQDAELFLGRKYLRYINANYDAA